MCWTIGCAVRPAASTLLESESERQARAYLPESESGSSTFCSLLVGTLVFHHQQNNTYSFQNKITFYRVQLRCDSTQCKFPPCPLDHLLVVPETRFVQKKMLWLPIIYCYYYLYLLTTIFLVGYGHFDTRGKTSQAKES